MKVRVLLGQLSPKLGDVEANLSRLEQVVRSHEADLAVFPELYLAGYFSKDRLYRLAMTLGDRVVGRLRRLAEENSTAIITGFPERSSHGYIYNSALIVDERGEVSVYRKRHLPTFSLFDESRWFRPSKARLQTWRLKGVEVGVAICYDTFFPEIFKSYSLLGAELLAIISATPDSSLRFFRMLTEARAVENTVYVVWVNQVGVYDGVGFAGRSRVISPLGRLITECKPMDEDVRVAELDLREVGWARIQRPVLRDSAREDAESLLDSYLAMEEAP